MSSTPGACSRSSSSTCHLPGVGQLRPIVAQPLPPLPPRRQVEGGERQAGGETGAGRRHRPERRREGRPAATRRPACPALPRPAQPVNSGLLPPRPGRIGGGKAAGVQCHHREGGQGEGLPATGSDRGDRPTVHSATAHLDALHQAWGGIGLHNGCLHNGRTDALWLAPGRKRRPNGTRPSPALPTLYRSRSRMGRRRRQRRQQPQHQPPEVFHPPATIS